MSTRKTNRKELRDILEAYSPISDDSLERLGALLILKYYQKGDYLVRSGQIARKMLFVRKGIIISSYISLSGKPHIKNFFVDSKPAASMVSLISKVPSSFDLIAVEDSEVFEIDYDRYRELLFKFDDLQKFYITYLEKNWIIENERKHLSFATETASQRYTTFLQEYPDLEQRIAHKHIAAYLGITPTQLSRIRKLR